MYPFSSMNPVQVLLQGKVNDVQLLVMIPPSSVTEDLWSWLIEYRPPTMLGGRRALLSRPSWVVFSGAPVIFLVVT